MHCRVRCHPYRFISTVLLLVFPFTPLLGQSTKDVQMTSTSERGCSFIFSPQDVRIDTVFLQDKPYQKYHLYLGGDVGEPGEPMIPFCV